MSTEKHSPLPWRTGEKEYIFGGTPFHEYTSDILSGDKIIARRTSDVEGVESEANAALIVARVNGWDALQAERDRLKATAEIDGATIDALTKRTEQLSAELATVRAENKRLCTITDNVQRFANGIHEHCAPGDYFTASNVAECLTAALAEEVRP